MKILALGAGVQSSALAFMSEKGVIDKLDCAIFSDTMNEPPEVYKWLKYVKSNVSFPVYKVKHGDLMRDASIVRTALKSGNRYMKGIIPMFVLNEDGTKGLLGRMCTTDYKIRPLIKKTKELLGIKRMPKNQSELVELWIGISIDEADRKKDSRNSFIRNRHPLLEMELSRQDCLDWMNKNGYPQPPRSACIACPFHSDKEWLRLKTQDPKSFQKAVEIERKLQKNSENTILKGKPFLHSSCVPLDQVYFKNEKGHQQIDLFKNECEGLCGV